MSEILSCRFLKTFDIDPACGDFALIQAVCSVFAGIPYENSTKLINFTKNGNERASRRLPEEVLNDYVRYSAGGTCYSLVWCLSSLLRELGINARPVTADTSSGSDTHSAVIVTLSGSEYLIDPGYLILSPLKIAEGGETRIERPVFDLVIKNEPGELSLFTERNGQKRKRSAIKTGRITDSDYFDLWDKSFSGTMMNSLIITKYIGNRLYYLKNERLQITSKTGQQVEILGENYENKVAGIFAIDPSLITEAKNILKF